MSVDSPALSGAPGPAPGEAIDGERRPADPLYWMVPLAVVIAIASMALSSLTAGELSSVDLSLNKLTLNAHYHVLLVPLSGPPSVGPIEDYTLTINTPTGIPVDDATITVGGEMPAHGHGLPTGPVITKAADPGKYLVQGVKFSMAGYWELIFRMNSPKGGQDIVTFNVIL